MTDELERAATTVHDILGIGFTESVYHSALERELSERGVAFTSEGTIPVMYKGMPVGRRRPDLFVLDEDGNKIVVELKAGSTSGEGQLMQYLSLMDEDSNVEDIVGGAVIRFNEELEYEYHEL